MRILAIESSCDETAIALLKTDGRSLFLEKNQVYSQINIHRKFGGVVPEVAARKHLETIIPLLDSSLGRSKLDKIDFLAVTSGPGLITSLLLGITVAQTLAYTSQLPLYPINHLEGHIYSNWLSNKELVKNEKKYWPALILVVSGGHTELILMKGHGDYQRLGQTLDDAAGESFDKIAKFLSLGYPGGSIISQWAKKGNSAAYNFPRPMIDSHDYNFSFSGLKTAVLYALEKKKNINQQDIADIAASFQQAVVEVLIFKTFQAIQQHKVKAIMLAGGVAANQLLKEKFQQKSDSLNLLFFYPRQRFSGDNAAMIAAAAYYHHQQNRKPLQGIKILSLQPQVNWQLIENRI
ncbi:MAG: tRNA (adenosine(37)-N6)-threonylcarbamoyltransferase complex transferase subunit TsaD [Candidatus Komeilibacteria bacterium CG11_big_fil_rev_8_21_14_0_20_36_20]|uniref:tRNA N6-adenosine threonylcarbamoyltransferase n=1 Tax=Candidatus Komeilibacteria bacterium CG11_big_fil_rev_8_21_14_0_20_36_20 TaxID=1974477 RepID=A0A2H0ND25_9BACT|nr:MAG: tRNA (adenosine(37)-N6)-threonylcarbamoyltransferase complex transferase subunit TsaD [Candidatus Komeilibacteria bacterium CG11_big_fil_rev_8_21_14_0_20_36_20]PIR81825.1 MAG: tRNA (adenosine(37)-N6)-threonylcarbamoyltransferase complex transferase subunit TsaD [Candidatus Komeilibacteria bacterium CG10_big_fil_rev_8_21_14_0_10_36_65]PJC55315.1 MAG: tRNA (adenosine(37)-N6)-threonylcarbamoyltransferase complex transferase subunit TsaD [Candidatus Komeilibacteria bacterium CG_4_9_14_0_2_um_